MGSAWIQTRSGRALDLEDPQPDQIEILDISWGLARCARFAGQTVGEVAYSVAQHCVLASRLVEPKHAVAALMHDASEAYLGDVAAPLKSLLPDYRRVEARLMAAIAARFGFAHPLPAEVKRVDLLLLATEKRDLMAPEPKRWLPLPPPLPESIEVWPVRQAHDEFIARFCALGLAQASDPTREAWARMLEGSGRPEAAAVMRGRAPVRAVAREGGIHGKDAG